MFKCSSGKLLQKSATACHKICVPDPLETSCSSCSHSRKITVIYKFTAVYIHVQNVYFFAGKNVQLNVNIHVLTVELE